MLRLKPGVQADSVTRELWFALGAVSLMRFRLGRHDTTVLEVASASGACIGSSRQTLCARVSVDDLHIFDRNVLAGALREALAKMRVLVYTNDAGLHLEVCHEECVLFAIAGEPITATREG